MVPEMAPNTALLTRPDEVDTRISGRTGQITLKFQLWKGAYTLRSICLGNQNSDNDMQPWLGKILDAHRKTKGTF